MPNGADQREVAFVGAGENQPPVIILEHIDVVGIEQPPDHDLADLDRGNPGRGHPQHGFRDRRGPGTRCVDQRARRDDLTVPAVDHRQPPDVEPVSADAARAGADVGTPLGRVDRIEHHQPGIVRHAVGILKRKAESAAAARCRPDGV